MGNLILLLRFALPAFAQERDRNQHIADLERQLGQAQGSMAAQQKTIDSLSMEMQALRQSDHSSSETTAAALASKKDTGEKPDAGEEFASRIIGSENRNNEHDNRLNARPEIFIQTRHSVASIEGSGTAFDPVTG